MPLKLDPKIDIADARQIALGDEFFYIPRLMFRQLEIIGPLIPAALTIINRRAGAFRAVPLDDKGAPLALSPDAIVALTRELGLSADEMATAFAIVHAGLTRAYPAATKDQLRDMPISPAQLAEAMGAVIEQTSVTKPKKDMAPGEREAASR